MFDQMKAMGAIAGLLVPGLHRDPRLWTLLTAAFVTKTGLHWWTQDNHLFLLTYWCIALWLVLCFVEPARRAAVLRPAAQILIGHSLGGAAVLAVAERLPEVRAVATLGAPASTKHLAERLSGLRVPDYHGGSRLLRFSLTLGATE